MHIDINCDMGEGMGNDEGIMPFITSANIACGYHAGDEQTMRSTILLAKQHGVNIGAHPSFPDKENFGRTEMQFLPQDVYHLVMQQLKIFQTIADECEAKIHHVKPHGALYNMAARDQALADAFALAVKDFNGHLIVYGLSNSFLISEAKRMALQTKSEVFADRTYQDDGSLTPRSLLKALIEDGEKAVQQVLQMVQHKTVTTASRKKIPIVTETVCVHGDGKNAIALAKKLYQALEQQHLVTKKI
jgi:UPF0271 protein